MEDIERVTPAQIEKVRKKLSELAIDAGDDAQNTLLS